MSFQLGRLLHVEVMQLVETSCVQVNRKCVHRDNAATRIPYTDYYDSFSKNLEGPFSSLRVFSTPHLFSVVHQAPNICILSRSRGSVQQATKQAQRLSLGS
ncbi:hypothetical protein RUM44_004251 [Polyplax serrata]|uniref:Uncharacterized protein n=1 Tax=Polyplax serrata TaxID=468196 RepID=A0ABR1B2B1_POLSC